MDEAEKQVPKQLKPYIFKKGVSGNPNGRPKGKTLKEFARAYLESLPDDEKIDYLQSLPTELIWQMAEGKAKQETETEVKGNLTINRITFDEYNDSSQSETK